MRSAGSTRQQLHRARRLSSGGVPLEADFDPDHKYQSFCTDNNTLAFLEQPPASDASCRPLGDPGRLSEYLNRADVRAALGVRPGKQLAAPWARTQAWTPYRVRGIVAGYWEAYRAPGSG